MFPASKNKPTQAQLIFPLLDVVQEMGGKARARDVGEVLGKRFLLPAGVTSETVTTGDGQTVQLWQRHVRFARQKAVAMGYLTSAGRGLWSLTDEGQEGMKKASGAIVVTVFTDRNQRPCSAMIDINVGLPTVHTLHCGDARDLSWINDGQIPLAVTSVPYFDLKEYESTPGQLAEAPSYEAFLAELDAVWAECFRVLAPGARLACNCGDVLRSRARHQSHHLLPLHADILVRCRQAGFQALNGILWAKKTNCSYEQGGKGILGKPGQPNGVIKSEIEHVLLFKKPGPYRSPTPEQQELSRISQEEYSRWYRPIWDDVPGARAGADHPAPFPVELPYRLIRMFSFAGDTVLDPFSGRFTTTVAAMKAGRNSIGVEVAQPYFEAGVRNACAAASTREAAPSLL